MQAQAYVLQILHWQPHQPPARKHGPAASCPTPSSGLSMVKSLWSEKAACNCILQPLCINFLRYCTACHPVEVLRCISAIWGAGNLHSDGTSRKHKCQGNGWSVEQVCLTWLQIPNILQKMTTVVIAVTTQGTLEQDVRRRRMLLRPKLMLVLFIDWLR